MKLILEARHKRQIDAIILQYPYAFFAYGSRAKGTAKEFSDLDLCVWDDISVTILGEITGRLNELRLPFSIDVVAWHKIDSSFKSIIRPDFMRYSPDVFLGASVIDLAYPLFADTPVWPGNMPFTLDTTNDYDQLFRCQQFKCSSGVGTHVDAPAHIVPGGKDAASIMTKDLVDVCSVYYPKDPVEESFVLTAAMLKEYEEQYGPLTENCWFLVMTGWGEKAADSRAYSNIDEQGNMRFPTISLDAAELLIDRKVRGVGIDTLSPDLNNSDFPVHRALLNANIVIIENVRYETNLPISAGMLQVVPLNIPGGTESPVRLFFSSQAR